MAFLWLGRQELGLKNNRFEEGEEPRVGPTMTSDLHNVSLIPPKVPRRLRSDHATQE